MKRYLGVLAAVAFWAGPAAAQDNTIEDVITSQLQAFVDRDVDAAWGYASPVIKRIFRTPDNFGMMVRNGYPMVWDNSDALFLDREDMQNVTRQEVRIQGPDGLYYILDYDMVQTPNGWLIDAVRVIPAPDPMS